MADRVTIGAGDWSDATKWDGGVSIPSATQSVQISHAMTKDSAAPGASYDCTDIYIDNNITLTIGASGGLKANGVLYMSGTGATLAIGGRAVTFTGKINGATSNFTGKITGTAGGSLTCDYIQTGNRITWDLQGSSGSQFTLTCSSTATNSYINGDIDTDVGACIWTYVNFIGTTKSKDLYWGGAATSDIISYCAFTAWSSCRLNGIRTPVRNSYFYGNATGLNNYNTVGQSAYSCTFGKDRSGSSSANTTADVVADNGLLFVLGGSLNSTTPIGASANGAVLSQGADAAGGWRNSWRFCEAYKSADAKKSGDWGIVLLPRNANITTNCPLAVDIPIPVESGDVIAPSIYFVNTGADLDLHNTDNGLTFELDPGNEWGLNETIDADDLDDSYDASAPFTWIEAELNGDSTAAGGTSKKGTCILRVTLRKYVASAVVYLADLTW